MGNISTAIPQVCLNMDYVTLASLHCISRMGVISIIVANILWCFFDNNDKRSKTFCVNVCVCAAADAVVRRFVKDTWAVLSTALIPSSIVKMENQRLSTNFKHITVTASCRAKRISNEVSLLLANVDISKWTLEVDRIRFVWLWTQPITNAKNRKSNGLCCMRVALYCWGLHLRTNDNWISTMTMTMLMMITMVQMTKSETLCSKNRNLLPNQIRLRILYIDLHTFPDIWSYCLIHFMG